MASERPDPRTLRIREIYRSIQGESTRAGWPCAFVRTAGCDIRCAWCDEPHALTAERSESLSIDEIVARVRALDVGMVELTGGEPLLQPAAPALVRALLDAGFEVLIETGGHRDVSLLDPRCKVILDVKAPGSSMEAHNDPANLARLKPGDEVKYVLAGRADYEWARKHLLEHGLAERVPVQFSPVHGVLDPRDLAAWILEDGLRVRLNLQLHKYVWGPEAKGV
jgi:7-carboxy-7-deazaguanine synthase